jgi:hypothetical protein
VVYAFAGKNEESRLAIDRLRKLYPTFTVKEFVLHELYRNQMDLKRGNSASTGRVARVTELISPMGSRVTVSASRLCGP